MHIIAGLLSMVTVVSIVAYRLYLISQSRIGQDLTDAVGSIQKGVKRRAWQRKCGDPLREVDDARIAAAAMMVALAQMDNPLSAREETIIAEQMKSRFHTNDTVTAELLAYARWLVRDVLEPENCFLKVRPVILRSCNQRERNDLIEMMTVVADAGSDSVAQNAIVARLAHTLKT